MHGKKDAFDAAGQNYGVSQLAFDPTVRHWVNYHSTQAFSPDGRFVCYVHDSSNRREFVHRGDRRGYYRDGQFVDTPRE